MVILAGVGSRGRRVRWLAAASLVMVMCTPEPECGDEGGPRARNSMERPDVVLISMDTLRRDHLPFHGARRSTAPHLTELASSSLVFEHAFAAHTNTGPSHASILTGLYPPKHGILRNRYHLGSGVVPLAQILGEEGYQTVGVTSSVMLSDRLTGLGRGFERYEEVAQGQSDRQANETWEVARRVLGDLDPGKPLFLFFHLFDPHYPYRAPVAFSIALGSTEAEEARFPENADLPRLRSGGAAPGELEVYMRRYDAEIRFADQAIGRLFNTLKDLGRLDRSIVIFLSDHGETLVERPFVFDHGGRAYEEQIRVPLLFHLPGGLCGGRRMTREAHHVDVVPTLLDLLGLPIPGDVQGVSLLPGVGPIFVSGQKRRVTENAREGDLRCPGRNRGRAVSVGRPGSGRQIVSFARPEPDRVSHIQAPLVREGLVIALRVWPWKLIAYPGQGRFYHELFRLDLDPLEQHNLAQSDPAQLARMKATLDHWLAATGGDLGRPVPRVPSEDEAMLRSLGYAR